MTVLINATAKDVKKSAKVFEWSMIREWWINRNLLAIDNQAVTLTDVAEHFEISYNSVRNRCKTEGWKKLLEERMKWRDEAVTQQLMDQSKKAIEQVSEQDINDEVKVRTRHTKLARLAQKKALDKLNSIDAKDLSVRDAIALMKLGIDEERKALGFADKYEIEHKGEINLNNFTMESAHRVIEEIIDMVENDGGVFTEAEVDD